jgi:hypothetical protein
MLQMAKVKVTTLTSENKDMKDKLQAAKSAGPGGASTTGESFILLKVEESWLFTVFYL